MKKWLLKEVWNQQDWGSPDMNEVQVQPNLNLFLSKCKERDIKVGLSSWYRLDVDEVCLKLDTPEKLADCLFSLKPFRMSVGGIGIRRNPYDG